MEEVYEIHALRYGSNQNRTRQENFLETVDDHDSAMPLDYFVWLIRNENRAVVVDTGFDHIEAKNGRGPSRPCLQRDWPSWESIPKGLRM